MLKMGEFAGMHPTDAPPAAVCAAVFLLSAFPFGDDPMNLPSASQFPESSGGSPNQPAGAPQPSRSGAPRTRPGWSRWIIWLALAVLLIRWDWRGEVVRWKLATAERRAAQGDFAGATRALDRAQQWLPDKPLVPLARAELAYASERWDVAVEAFREVERLGVDLDGIYPSALRAGTLLPLQSPDALGAGSMFAAALFEHGQLEEALGRFARLERTTRGGSPMRRATVLNNWAYFLGLARKDLGHAFQLADQAVQLQTSANNLDTRGYVALQLGQLALARRDLDAAVGGVEQELAQLTAAMNEQDAMRMEMQPLRELWKAHRHTVAVVRYHRALALEQLGEAVLAAEDYARIRDLGFEPGEHLR